MKIDSNHVLNHLCKVWERIVLIWVSFCCVLGRSFFLFERSVSLLRSLPVFFGREPGRYRCRKEQRRAPSVKTYSRVGSTCCAAGSPAFGAPGPFLLGSCASLSPFLRACSSSCCAARPAQVQVRALYRAVGAHTCRKAAARRSSRLLAKAAARLVCSVCRTVVFRGSILLLVIAARDELITAVIASCPFLRPAEKEICLFP